MSSKEPSRTKVKNAAIAAKPTALPKIPKELLDQVMTGEGPMSSEQINAKTMALIERALGWELSYHLGYPPGAPRVGIVAAPIET